MEEESPDLRGCISVNAQARVPLESIPAWSRLISIFFPSRTSLDARAIAPSPCIAFQPGPCVGGKWFLSVHVCLADLFLWTCRDGSPVCGKANCYQGIFCSLLF